MHCSMSAFNSLEYKRVRLNALKMEENPDDELFVFGYSCKLFRDDERAAYIDKGQHLIPWNGDNSLPIDRFDVRGLLSDLSTYEAKNLQKNTDYLTQEEALVEEMCDDERYRSLNIVDDKYDEDLDDEEAKRGKTNAIGFDYNSPEVIAQPVQPQMTEEEYIRGLASVIEKTSEFIARQGVQMEILMRAKEAENPKFQFLNPDNPYHSIYKQVLAKKQHRLKFPTPIGAKPEEPFDVEKSLRNLTRNLPSAAPNATTKSDSTTSDCAYSQLVEKIRENQANEKSSNEKTSNVKTSTPPSPVPSIPPEVEEEDDDSVMVSVPDPELQRLIDQTAFYVCKYGYDKLAVVKKRQKDKFEFLFPGSKFNLYYQYKVALYNEMKANDATIVGDTKNDGKIKKFPILKGFFN